MTNAPPASDRALNRVAVRPRNVWHHPVLAGCAALAFGIVQPLHRQVWSGTTAAVNAFWSLTMYELPASLLTENPIGRYLINSQVEPNLVRDADGGITLYIQQESPGKNREPNWLPAPKGPFFMVLRDYSPKPEALNGSWTVPSAMRATQ